MPTPIDEVHAYCDACAALVVMIDPKSTTTNTDKPYFEGHCPDCEAKLAAIPPKASELD